MKKLILSLLVTLAGAVALAGSASAQVYNGNTSVGGPQISGSYHVTLTEFSPTSFQITGIFANTGLQQPSASISSLKVQFYNTLTPTSIPIGVAQVTGAAGTQNTPWFSGIGGPGGASFPATYAVFKAFTGSAFLSTGGVADANNGVFSQVNGNGMIILNGTPSPVRSVLFTLTDANNHAYTFFDYVNTPETSSLLLLGAALLPFAFFMRRRAKQNTA